MNLKTFALLATCSVAALLATAETSHARAFRVAQVPNGDAFQCGLCHEGGVAGAARTAFGLQVEETLVNENVDWGAIFDLDADGDGFTNGQELADPDGDGLVIDGVPATDPSDPTSRPECAEDLDCDPDGSATGRRICLDGVCVDGGGDFACQEDRDCDPNTFCVEGRCLTEADINPCAGRVCEAGQMCVDGACVEGTTGGATSGTGGVHTGSATAGATGDASGDGANNGTGGAMMGDDDEEDAGCQVAPGRGTGEGAVALLLLAWAAWVGRAGALRRG